MDLTNLDSDTEEDNDLMDHQSCGGISNLISLANLKAPEDSPQTKLNRTTKNATQNPKPKPKIKHKSKKVNAKAKSKSKQSVLSFSATNTTTTAKSKTKSKSKSKRKSKSKAEETGEGRVGGEVNMKNKGSKVDKDEESTKEPATEVNRPSNEWKQVKPSTTTTLQPVDPKVVQYKCKKCESVISDASALIESGGKTRRRLKFSRCMNVEQKRIEPEGNSENDDDDDEVDHDGNWCAMRCQSCRHFFGNQLLAETPVYTFRRVDLIVCEPKEKDFDEIQEEKASCRSLKRKQPPQEQMRLSSTRESKREVIDLEDEAPSKKQKTSGTGEGCMSTTATASSTINQEGVQRELTMLKYVVLNMMERLKELEAKQPQGKRQGHSSKFGKELSSRRLIPSERRSNDEENKAQNELAI